MSSKYFDIPFLPRSHRSDFSCKDGEISSAKNLLINGVDAEAFISSSLIGSGSYPSEEGGINVPPEPEVDFAMVRTTLNGWHVSPDDFPSLTLSAKEPTMEYWNDLVRGLLTQFKTEVRSQHLFVAPFFVMAAWKTVAGTYLNSTKPLLMIPNSELPWIGTYDSTDASEVNFKIAAAVGSLYFKIKAPEVLREWVGIISSLEILVSSPLIEFSNDQPSLPVRRVSPTTFSRCLDLTTGKISDERITTVTFPQAWKGVSNYSGTFTGIESSEITEISTMKFYPFASVPLGEVDRATVWGAAGLRGIGDFLYGYSRDGIKYSALLGIPETASPKDIIITGEGKSFSLTTRPLKLTKGGEFKMCRFIYLRGHYTSSNITLEVEGSRDMQKWWKIAKSTGNTVAVLPHTYFRFFRVSVTGVLGMDETLEGLSIT